MRSLLILALAAGGALASVDEDAKNRPVSKVTTLLKDMVTQLEKEAAEDAEIYDNMACWCSTNDAAKTKAIKDAEVHIKKLTTKILELTAMSARLNAEIAQLEKEVAQNQKALDQATKLREQQLAEFNAEESDMLSAITSLGSAIETLSKHNGGSLLQVQSVLKNVFEKHSAITEQVLTPSERTTATQFLQASTLDYFDETSKPGGGNSYAPQSGQIFGILKGLKESFETNLSQSQKDELASQKAYEELKAAKEDEIAAGKAQIEAKTGELADTDEKNAQAKQDREDTENTLAADEEFLYKLKQKCALTDKEFEERTKTRQLEMEAVNKALQVLTSDEAMDTMSRTFSLVQERTSQTSERRSAASQVLLAAARSLHSPKLTALAMRVKLDAFTKVKKAIDDLIAQLLQDKADEIKHKDFCTDELNKNQLETEEKDRQKTDLLARIEDLEMTIAELAKAIANLKAEIADLQVQLKRAGEDREKQNKEFQLLVTDQRQAQQLLQGAKDILGEFYGLVQQEPAGPPPPAGFKTYKKSAGAGGVMSMIQQIIDDTKAMEAEAIKAENDSQKTYETIVKETNASIDAKAADIVNKSETKAKREGDLVEAKKNLDQTEIELTSLANYKAELHTSCDYVLKNFDIRQKGRDEEIEALRQAKAILGGAKFEAMLQETA